MAQEGGRVTTFTEDCALMSIAIFADGDRDMEAKLVEEYAALRKGGFGEWESLNGALKKFGLL